MAARPLPVLLDLIDAQPTDPFIMDRAVDAYQAGLISDAEVRHLRAFEARPAKSRKRTLTDAIDVSPEAMDTARAKPANAREVIRRHKEQQGP